MVKLCFGVAFISESRLFYNSIGFFLFGGGGRGRGRGGGLRSKFHFGRNKLESVGTIIMEGLDLQKGKN